jgi:hypothetical protein
MRFIIPKHNHILVRGIKSRMRWAGYIARMREIHQKNLEDLGADRTTILNKMNIKELWYEVWVGLNWLRIWSSGGLS